MQCPRCGLQNAPGAVQCMRCGHAFSTPAQDQPSGPAQPRSGPQQPAGGRPAGTQPRPGQPGGWQHPGYAPKPPPPPPPPPEPEYGSIWRVLAAIALTLATAACVVYGGWAATSRRGIFADLADGGSVTFEAAQDSDRLHGVLLWTAVGAVGLAVVLWLLAHLRRRKPLGIAGFTALALLVIGMLVAVGGAYLTSLVDGEVAEADRGALGFLIMGIGFLLVAGGMIAALVAVFVRPARRETPDAGFAGWRSP